MVEGGKFIKRGVFQSMGSSCLIFLMEMEVAEFDIEEAKRFGCRDKKCSADIIINFTACPGRERGGRGLSTAAYERLGKGI